MTQPAKAATAADQEQLKKFASELQKGQKLLQDALKRLTEADAEAEKLEKVN